MEKEKSLLTALLGASNLPEPLKKAYIDLLIQPVPHINKEGYIGKYFTEIVREFPDYISLPVIKGRNEEFTIEIRTDSGTLQLTFINFFCRLAVFFCD